MADYRTLLDTERGDAVMKKSAISALAVILALSACATDQRGQKEVGGALLGAVVGGLLGSKIGGGKGQLAATAAGTLLGGYLGSEAGKSLDRADKVYAERAAQRGLESNPSGSSSSWSNPDTRHSGSVTPLNTYRSGDGLHCRDYRQVITVEGRSETARGTACRESDGTWRVVNSR
jgi:surface antigen